MKLSETAACGVRAQVMDVRGGVEKRGEAGGRNQRGRGRKKRGEDTTEGGKEE